MLRLAGEITFESPPKNNLFAHNAAALLVPCILQRGEEEIIHSNKF
jgi:hypothetical protein